MKFTNNLLSWYTENKRSLPWRETKDPYKIWLSEIILQQTRVAQGLPYYLKFVEQFPTVFSLAKAKEQEVLRLWQGLGYYSRARNLHKAAQVVVNAHGGRFPRRFEEVTALPGVGRSTAAAICIFSFGARHAILDGNVKRVLARLCGVKGYSGEKKVADRLWQEAERLLPRRGIEAYTQGLMDLGSSVCTRGKPRCDNCPLHGLCDPSRKRHSAALRSKYKFRVTNPRDKEMANCTE